MTSSTVNYHAMENTDLHSLTMTTTLRNKSSLASCEKQVSIARPKRNRITEHPRTPLLSPISSASYCRARIRTGARSRLWC